MHLGSIGPVELILIVLAIVLIFGASKLGDLGGALGKRVKDLKKAAKDDEKAAKDDAAEAPVRAAAAASKPRTVVISPQSTPATTAPAEPRAPSSTSLGVGDYRPPDGRLSESRPDQK